MTPREFYLLKIDGVVIEDMRPYTLVWEKTAIGSYYLELRKNDELVQSRWELDVHADVAAKTWKRS